MKPACALLCLLLLAAGCSQNTETPQVQVTPAQTMQGTATDGATVNVWILNGGPPVPDSESPTLMPDDTAATIDGPTEPEKLSAHLGALIQDRITINVTTGNMTPSVSGSTAPSVTGSVSANPSQEPQASLSIPIAIVPYGSSQQTSAAGLGSGTVTAEQQAQTEQRIARLEQAMADQASSFTEFLKSFMTTTPATQPTE